VPLQINFFLSVFSKSTPIPEFSLAGAASKLSTRPITLSLHSTIFNGTSVDEVANFVPVEPNAVAGLRCDPDPKPLGALPGSVAVDCGAKGFFAGTLANCNCGWAGL
jgi:hypothetical protein